MQLQETVALPQRTAEHGRGRPSRARDTSRRRLATTRSADTTDAPAVTFTSRATGNAPAQHGATTWRGRRQSKHATAPRPATATQRRRPLNARQPEAQLPTDIDFSQTQPPAKTAREQPKPRDGAKSARTPKRPLSRTLGRTLDRTLKRTRSRAAASSSSGPCFICRRLISPSSLQAGGWSCASGRGTGAGRFGRPSRQGSDARSRVLVLRRGCARRWSSQPKRRGSCCRRA